MKHLKISALVGLAAVALATFAAGASAATLTSPAGTTYTGAVSAETEGETIIHEPWVKSTCKSKLGWETASHGAGIPVSAVVTSLYFLECSGSTTVTPLKLGTLSIHTRNEKADGDGTLTWIGPQITSLTHHLFMGTIDCIYGTSPENADIGVITGSSSTGGTARIKIDATLIRLGGNAICPATSEWTAAYEIKTPDYLDVD